MTTAADVIAQAAKWVGFVEAPVNRTPFGRWYGMDGQPYCAMALSYWTYHAGLPVPASTSKGYAYTPSGANWFKARGRWGTTPRVGAHVFFRFSGDRIHHVGLVTGVNADGSIDTIEANTSAGSAGSQRDGGGVWRRRRAAGIVGYGYPDYSAAPAPAPTPAPIEEDDMDSRPFDLDPGESIRLSVEPANGFFGRTASLLLLDVRSADGDQAVWVWHQHTGGGKGGPEGKVVVRGGQRWTRPVDGGWLDVRNDGTKPVFGALLTKRV